jgi:hypothetical protein
MAFKIKANIPAATPSIDPKRAAKHFDIVLGLDFHILKVPWPITPCPITPFSALVFDPMDYIHCTLPAMPVYDEKGGFQIVRDVPMGGTVLINNFYRAAAQGALWGLPSVPPFLGKVKGLGSIVKNLNLLHFVIPQPLFLLPKFFHPHEGQMSHGSKTVLTQGMYQSTFLCRAYSCQDVGKILMNNPTGGFYLNFLTAIVAVLPMGKPVIVGGPKKEQELKLADLINSLMFMGITHGAKFAAGRLLKGLKAIFENKRLGKNRSIHPVEMDAMKRQSRFNDGGERVMTVREFKQFKKDMAIKGVKVVLDKKRKILTGDRQAGFDPHIQTLYLKKPPKIYDAMHEGFHAEQWHQMGHEAYNSQNRLQKEQYVYEQLMENKESLTESQINHAGAYIEFVESGNWPPFDTKTKMYILNNKY